MNVIDIRQEKRKAQIQQIAENLKKVFSTGLDINKEKLILEICSQFGTSRRTSLEYLNIALLSIDCAEETINNKKFLVQKSQEPK